MTPANLTLLWVLWVNLVTLGVLLTCIARWSR